MVVQATEISRLLKEQIAGFQDQATITNVGQVVEVGDGIARAYGLSQVMFPSGSSSRLFAPTVFSSPSPK